jgi:hypothetical protein
METYTQIKEKYLALQEYMDERTRRIWAATEARTIGRGGITAVSKATGLARTVIYAGLYDLDHPDEVPREKIRRAGGGRKSITEHNPDFPRRLESLVEPLVRGDPESPLRWTCKSVRQLAKELTQGGIAVGHQTVARELDALGYSLQSNRKCVNDGKDNPDRNAQFEYINKRAGKDLKAGNPVISVDMKKKGRVGNYKNPGRTGQEKKKPEKVTVHDFPGPDIVHAYPYGIYDLKGNEGFVNVREDQDREQFTVASIRVWWLKVGKGAYLRARRIQIMADSGGSNGIRRRQWKDELQRLADDKGLTIGVCHYLPGTGKWNKEEHRLFAFISRRWRGEPLESFETIVKLIGTTTTSKGHNVYCRLGWNDYPTKVKVIDEEMEQIRLFKKSFHGEWNYDIKPHKK